MSTDFIVVGAGLTGSVIARELAEHGFNVDIWERRPHIGGNLYDCRDHYGINIHKYGPHAFHTNDRDLIDYLEKFEEWIPFELKCGALINDKTSPTPFNFKTVDMYFSEKEGNEIKNALKTEFGNRTRITVHEAMNSENPLIRKYANFLFDNDYEPYTSKQWGLRPEDIDKSVMARVPLLLSYDECYFDDTYQVMPKHSYSEFFRNLLDHKNISVTLNKNALSNKTITENTIDLDSKKTKIVYTGPLDELFDYIYGKLPYRTLKFDVKYYDVKTKQQYPIIARPQDENIVRTVEYTKLPEQINDHTVCVDEYSFSCGDGDEPYYPIIKDTNITLHDKYVKLADTKENLYYSGRLADYRYYDMDDALSKALSYSKRIIESN